MTNINKLGEQFVKDASFENAVNLFGDALNFETVEEVTNHFSSVFMELVFGRDCCSVKQGLEEFGKGLFLECHKGTPELLSESIRSTARGV